MSHKTRVNGTLYDVKGGKALIGGTEYKIKKGRTLIAGTGYDIALETAGTETETWTLVKAPHLPDSSVTYDLYGTYGVTFESDGTTYGAIRLTKSTIGYRLTGMGEVQVYRQSSGGGSVAMSLAAREISPSAIITSGWGKIAYRTIIFSHPITSSMFNGSLLSWLQNNTDGSSI